MKIQNQCFSSAPRESSTPYGKGENLLGIEVVKHSPSWVPAVKAFNKRIAAKGSKWSFYERPNPNWLPPTPNTSTYREYFLAVENDMVRGGYVLKHQPFSIFGRICNIASVEGPLTEGVVNNEFGGVVFDLLRHMHQVQPLLFGWGMGGPKRTLPQILRVVGWSACHYPWCYFAPISTGRIENSVPMATLKMIGDFHSESILNPTPNILQASASSEAIEINEVSDFGSWVEKIWRTCSKEYSMIGVRDLVYLRSMFPKEDNRYTRLKISNQDQVIGWVILAVKTMEDHEIFGSLRVVLVWDCLSAKTHIGEIVRSILKYAKLVEADVVISCNTNLYWVGALKTAGFREYSGKQRVLSFSRSLTNLLEPISQASKQMLFNDADGDGPIGFLGNAFDLSPE